VGIVGQQLARIKFQPKFSFALIPFVPALSLEVGHKRAFSPFQLEIMEIFLGSF
jgi:hypothetical protein